MYYFILISLAAVIYIGTMLVNVHGTAVSKCSMFIHTRLIHPSHGATAQIGPWPPLLRFRNNNALRCEVVSLTTNPS
jgi:hypothetical protein